MDGKSVGEVNEIVSNLTTEVSEPRQCGLIRVIFKNLKLGGYEQMFGGVQTCAKCKFTLNLD